MRYLLPFQRKLFIIISLSFIIFIILNCSQSESDSGIIPNNGSNGELVDLHPGYLYLTNSADTYVADGTAVAITLLIQNLGADDIIPTPSFNVQFYISEDENLGMDHILEEISLGTTISGNSTYNLVTNITIPEDLALNQCIYIWADVDNSNLISSEIDEGNNQSSISSALCLLVYDNEDAGRSYEMVFETFPPTGVNPTPTPSLVLNIYDHLGNNIEMDWTGYPTIIRSAGTSLTPGTHYVKIENFSVGAYGLSIRSFSIMPIPYFINEQSSEGDDPYEIDDADTGNDNIPDSPVSLRVGSALNRYSGTGDIDWIEIVLP